MALVLHIGGAESNSFITVAEADSSILAQLPDDSAEWFLLNTLAKELRLWMGVELMGHLPLRGRKVFRNQRLCFPRTSQPYEGRFLIPESVKLAQAYIAYSVVHRMFKERPPLGGGEEAAWGKPKSISLAGLVSVSFGGEATGGTLESMVRSLAFPAYMMLKPYLTQIRGGAVPNPEDLPTLSTTTTTTSTTV